jgi:hypothetical protein
MPYLHKDHIELRTSESRVEDNTGLPRRGENHNFTIKATIGSSQQATRNPLDDRNLSNMPSRCTNIFPPGR